MMKTFVILDNETPIINEFIKHIKEEVATAILLHKKTRRKKSFLVQPDFFIKLPSIRVDTVKEYVQKLKSEGKKEIILVGLTNEHQKIITQIKEDIKVASFIDKVATIPNSHQERESQLPSLIDPYEYSTTSENDQNISSHTYYTEILIEEGHNYLFAIIKEVIWNQQKSFELQVDTEHSLKNAYNKIVNLSALPDGFYQLTWERSSLGWKIISVRPGGIHFECNKIIEYGTSINLLKERINFFMGRKPLINPTSIKPAILQHLSVDSEGTLRKITGKRKTLKYPFILEVYTSSKKRTIITPMSYQGHIVATGINQEQARVNVQLAAIEIKFHLTNNDIETLGSGGRLPADTQKISPKIISVTGSAGKTTTKSMIASILRERWKVFESANSRNTHVHTREHADLLKESVYQVAVVEYGMSYYKNIEKHCKQLQPSVGVITNVGTAHMGHFNGDVKEVAKAKSELIIGMEPSGVLYVNDDDENSQYLNTEAFQGTIRTIGTNQSCDYIASNIYYSLDGMKFEVTINNKKFPIYIPIYGNHNVYNALFAIAVSYEQGLSIEEIQNGLAKFMKPKRRITVDKLSENVLLIDDCHSSNPNALKAAIDVLENISTFQNVVVLGSMLELGKSSPSIHCEIGEYLVNKKVDYLFTYGRQARMIYNCAISAGFPPERAGHFANHTMLKHELAKRTENTTFLVKGSRKMNMEEIVEFIRELIIQQE